MFENATRLKIRFESPNGLLTTEDIWELPLTSSRRANLDDIAKGLNRELKDSDTESFVTSAPSKANELIQLKFDIVKHVIGVKLAENEAANAKEAARAKKGRILEIIAKKEDAALEGASREELEAMLASL